MYIREFNHWVLQRLAAEAEEEEHFKNMTPEERAAEKKRLQKLQEEADLKLAMDTLGVTANASVEGSIDGMVPTNKAEFTTLAQLISNRVCLFREMDEFPGFAEELVKNISLHCEYIRCGDQQSVIMIPNCFLCPCSKLDRHKEDQSGPR